MPEILEEPITEVKEPVTDTAQEIEFADSLDGEVSDADHVAAIDEPIVEDASTPEPPVLSDQVIEVLEVEEPTAAVSEPIAEIPEVVLDEADSPLLAPVAVDESTEIPVVWEPAAELDEPIAEVAVVDPAPEEPEHVAELEAEPAALHEAFAVVE